MPGTFTVLGVEKLVARMAASVIAAEKGAAQGIYKRGLSIFEKSQRIVPVEFGTLRSSGHVTQPRREGGGWVVEIGYGGAAAGYAIYVHEITTNYHRPPTQAKFLEQPALEEAAVFAGTMAVEMAGLFV